MAAATSLTLKGAIDGLRAKAFSAEELAAAHIAAIEQARPLNAFVLETPEQAIAGAKAADARIARGEARPLEGIPIGIKDLFCTEGVRTTAGSNILGNFKPTYESTVTANLWRDGGGDAGQARTWTSSPWARRTNPRRTGRVVNPRAAAASSPGPLTPGGSSGGSAAAVAAELCLGATATDTGGSIRQAGRLYCRHGRGSSPPTAACSRWALSPFASSLDQAGP